MLNPDRVKEIMLDPNSQNPDPHWSFEKKWNPLSLSEGYPGILILLAETQRNQLMPMDEAIHAYVLRIKEKIEAEGLEPDLSLYSGVAGICFALSLVSCERTRYQKMLTKLEEYLLKQIDKEYLQPMEECLKNKLPIFVKYYDPIQGLSGIGRYFLENRSQDKMMEGALQITEMLIKLTQPIVIEGHEVPGWFVSDKDPLNYRMQKEKGNFNLGLAHGVTSILSYLSIASLKGINLKGQREAIERMVFWLKSKSVTKNKATVWPSHVSWEDEINSVNHSLPTRDAWCYGTPGVARTLYLAAKALNNQDLSSFAQKAFHGIFERTFDQWDIPAPTVCHGVAGLLIITKEMAKDDASLNVEVEKLRQHLFSVYQEESAFGFKDIEPCRQGGYISLDKIGLLEGCVGTILSLLPTSQKGSPWHLPLLIS